MAAREIFIIMFIILCVSQAHLSLYLFLSINSAITQVLIFKMFKYKRISTGIFEKG